MKKTLLLFSLLSTAVLFYAQDTFSIVAADSVTREVGSAGASCLDLFAVAPSFEIGFLADLLPDKGAINTQAMYLEANQVNARNRMMTGYSPAQIVTWLSVNDATGNSSIRQYGIVGFSGNNVSAAGFTGNGCIDYKNHITGSIDGIHYSIQGNILLGQSILDSMESRFRKEGGSLAYRLMAALQGANVIGADTRCTGNGTSSLFAFVKVSLPTDADGSPSFNIGVRTTGNAQIEPIDSLQKLFDQQIWINPQPTRNKLSVFPNPSNGLFTIRLPAAIDPDCYVVIYNSRGKLVLSQKTGSHSLDLDLSGEGKGIYFYRILMKDGTCYSGKLLRE